MSLLDALLCFRSGNSLHVGSTVDMGGHHDFESPLICQIKNRFQGLHHEIHRCDVVVVDAGQRVGRDRLIELTGNRALTGFTAPKLLWLRRHEPEIYARIAHILLPKDYVRLQLCGEHAIDVADASGTLLLAAFSALACGGSGSAQTQPRLSDKQVSGVAADDASRCLRLSFLLARHAPSPIRSHTALMICWPTSKPS